MAHRYWLLCLVKYCIQTRKNEKKISRLFVFAPTDRLIESNGHFKTISFIFRSIHLYTLMCIAKHNVYMTLITNKKNTKQNQANLFETKKIIISKSNSCMCSTWICMYICIYIYICGPSIGRSHTERLPSELCSFKLLAFGCVPLNRQKPFYLPPIIKKNEKKK